MDTTEARESDLVALRAAGWSVAYVLVVLLGTRSMHAHLSLVWPASGLALLWLASSRSRGELALSTVLLSVLGVGLNLLTGAPLGHVVLALTFPLQPRITLALIRRWLSGGWTTAGWSLPRRSVVGQEPLQRLVDLGRLLLAVALGSLSFAVLATLIDALTIQGRVDGVVALARWSTGFTNMGITSLVVLFATSWIRRRQEAGLRLLTAPRRHDVAHLVGAALLALGIFGFSLTLNSLAPSSFLLVLAVVWVALRFAPVVTTLFCLLAASFAVTIAKATAQPLVPGAGPEMQMLLGQLYVVTLMVVGAVISMTRRQTLDTIERLERSETSLGLRAAQADLMLSKLSDGVAIVEEGGHYLQSNDALRTIMTGQPDTRAFTGSVPKAAAYHLYHPDGRPLANEDYPYLRAVQGHTVVDQEFHLRRPDASVGKILNISAYALPVRPGSPRQAMVVVRDVTRTRAQQDSMAHFAATVAHDLNNPLGVIDGWAEAIEEHLPTDDADLASVAPMVRRIRASAAQMRTFISDLLARAVAREQELQGQWVPLEELVSEVVANREHPGIATAVTSDRLPEVWADRLLLGQVLDNLIGNALKYVPPGRTPRVHVSSETSHGGWARINVRDNGIGIAPDQRDLVFTSFHRVEQHEKYAGTGLGLSICRQIVERHGGSIGVCANPDGVGSRFSFTMPLTPAAFAGATETTLASVPQPAVDSPALFTDAAEAPSLSP